MISPIPAPPNYPLRDPKYHLIETMRPLIEVHCGVLVTSNSNKRSPVSSGMKRMHLSRAALSTIPGRAIRPDKVFGIPLGITWEFQKSQRPRYKPQNSRPSLQGLPRRGRSFLDAGISGPQKGSKQRPSGFCLHALGHKFCVRFGSR